MKEDNLNNEYIEELDEEIINYKYIKRNKKLKESFKFEDLLTDEQVERLMKYKSTIY